MRTNFHHPMVALLLAVIVSISACTNSNKQDHAGNAEQEIYTCPMHPEITRNTPGSCPICGMDLVKKETGTKATAEVELDALLKPSNAFVISSVPVTTIEQKEAGMELNVVGTVAYDPRLAGAISSRVNGRIERLYIRYKYQPVKKGQRVMDIYSPDLLTAQQNLLFLLRNDADNASLISAARDRLLLLGMSASQVAEVVRSKTPRYSIAVFSNYSGFVTDVNTTGPAAPNNMQAAAAANQELSIKEGMYVKSGQSIFSVYNPGRAWVLLDVFPEQQGLVKPGNAVSVLPEASPQKKFSGKIDYIEPVFRPGSKTMTARVYFNNAALQLPIGSRVTANIIVSPKSGGWLPKEAVLSIGRDNIVFVKEAGGFRAHKIITGVQLNQYIQVTGGIAATDSVAINAQYLVDNEAFIKVDQR